MVDVNALREHFEAHPDAWHSTSELVTLLGGQDRVSEVENEARRLRTETLDPLYGTVRDAWQTVTERPESDRVSFHLTTSMDAEAWQSVVEAEMTASRTAEGHQRQEHAARAALALAKFTEAVR